jgi:arylamine N-acetyltransferase
MNSLLIKLNLYQAFVRISYMSVTKVNKDELAKIEATENKSLPFNENEYQNIAKTLVNPSKIQLPRPKKLVLFTQDKYSI